MSVEKRTRPISIGNTGVLVPCTIACTAIGMNGVSVAGLVSVITGEAVITKDVDVGCAGANVSVAAACTVTVGEADRTVAVAVGTGVAGRLAGRFRRRSTTATATDKRPPASDQRALATYPRRTR
jgi:hypothetical protein